MVDSHLRSAAGMADVNGTSTVAYFRCLKDMYNDVCNSSASLGVSHKSFEIAGVCVIHTDLNFELEWSHQIIS